MKKNNEFDYLYIQYIKWHSKFGNDVDDIPFTCGLSYWNWSKDYADDVC